MPKIIHNPRELIKLSRDELDELLLEEYKNPALLRELIRVSLLQLKEQTRITELYKEKKDNALDEFEKLRDEINEVIDKHKY